MVNNSGTNSFAKKFILPFASLKILNRRKHSIINAIIHTPNSSPKSSWRDKAKANTTIGEATKINFTTFSLMTGWFLFEWLIARRINIIHNIISTNNLSKIWCKLIQKWEDSLKRHCFRLTRRHGVFLSPQIIAEYAFLPPHPGANAAIFHTCRLPS